MKTQFRPFLFAMSQIPVTAVYDPAMGTWRDLIRCGGMSLSNAICANFATTNSFTNGLPRSDTLFD